MVEKNKKYFILFFYIINNTSNCQTKNLPLRQGAHAHFAFFFFITGVLRPLRCQDTGALSENVTRPSGPTMRYTVWAWALSPLSPLSTPSTKSTQTRAPTLNEAFCATTGRGCACRSRGFQDRVLLLHQRHHVACPSGSIRRVPIGQ